MTWAKLDDRMPTHPKVLRLSDPAFRLHIHGICHAAEHLTDGFLQEGVARALHPRAGRVIPELLDAGVWKPVDDGYEIHDYTDWNPTRTEVERVREARAEAGRVGGKRSKPLSKREANASANAQANAKQNGTPGPVPLTSEDRASLVTGSSRNHVEQVWQAYTQHHPRAAFTTTGKNNRKGIIESALRSHDPELLIAAIHGNHLDPWCNGQNGTGRQHHSLELILRDAEHIERYAAIAHEANGTAATEDIEATLAKARDAGWSPAHA